MVFSNPSHLWFRFLFGVILAEAIPVTGASAPTKEDSGWVSLFNGTTLDGFYSYFQGLGVVDLDKQDAFLVEGGMIHVPKAHPGGYTNLEGHLITLRQYSWYRVRVDYKFSTDMNSQNAGLVIHIDNDAALIGKITAQRPRSIEINTLRAEAAPWTLWSAMDLGPYITTTVKPGTTEYLPKSDGGMEWTNDPWGSRTIFSALPNPENPQGQWNHGEATVYGDSMIVCYLNGRLRTEGWHFQLRGSPSDPDPAKRIPCDRGGIGVQSEVQEIWYKNLDIMEFEPHTLRPLHGRTLALGDGYRKKTLPLGRTGETIKRFTVDGRIRIGH